MSRARELDSLIACVYDAALVPSRWEEALTRLQALNQSRAALASYWRLSGNLENSWSRFTGFADHERPQLARYFELINEDPRNAGMHRAVLNPVRFEDLCDWEEFTASRMYREVHQPLDMETGAIFMAVVEPGVFFTSAVMQSRDRPPITEEGMQDLADLAGHFGRSASIYHRMLGLERRQKLTQALLDTIPLGLFAVEGRDVVVSNRQGLRMAGAGQGVALRGGELRPVSAAGRTALNQAMEEARDTGDVVGLSLEAADGGHLPTVVTRLDRAAPQAMGVERASVAVYLTDPRRRALTRDATLQAMFGLTPAQARVLNLLVQGLDAQAIAARLGNSLETVRTHIRRVLDKTGAAGQADLIRMVMATAAALVQPSAG
jgi:DNA-binding CsgD family transcriptional regulator